MSRAYIADVTGYIADDFEFPSFEDVYKNYIASLDEKKEKLIKYYFLI